MVSSSLVACVAATVLLLIVQPSTSQRLPSLFVEGNKLTWIINGQSYQMQFKGVDITSALFSCVTNTAMFDGPTNASYISAIKGWNADIVRIPLNQDCWLGASYIDSQYSGAAYQAAVTAYVTSLVDSGLYVIVSLHWLPGAEAKAISEQPMPDGNSPAFWKSVAQAFSSMPGHVIFDLLNEPFPDNNAMDNPTAWGCWKNGGSSCPHITYTAVGFQTLLDDVRATGSKNIIMIGGINYANDLDSWTSYMPYDLYGRLCASWHSYNFNACNNQICWDLTIAPTTETVPVITGEIGENDCQGSYIGGLMDWLDSKVTSYLAWTFMTYGTCQSAPRLISDYTGTCTDAYGCTYKAHLAASARSAVQRDLLAKYYKSLNATHQ